MASRAGKRLATPGPEGGLGPAVYGDPGHADNLDRQAGALALTAPVQLIIVLPAYNEAANLPGLLDRIESTLQSHALPGRVIVVDDGSSDATAVVLAERTSGPRLAVVRHEKNQGLGAALRSGLMAACRIAAPDDIVITMDADQTHPPELMPVLCQRLTDGHDVVVASRFQPGAQVVGLASLRRFFSRAASAVFQTILPTPGLRDFTCGFRAYRAAVLHRAVTEFGEAFITEAGFQCMPEILLKLRRLPVRFGETPMTLRYDLKQGASKMKILRTAYHTLCMVLRERRRAGAAL